MIGRLRGIILEKQPPEVIVETHGVGYEVFMPMSCFYELPEVGQEVTLFTHFIVREDAQLLYGFNERQERALFRELIKVSGIGPKSALGILSGMSASQFVQAVESEAVTALMKLPGVGKKTAERLIVEMKDRLKGFSSILLNGGEEGVRPSLAEQQTVPQDYEAEAVAALVALGYKPQEAGRLIGKVAKTGVNSETLIRDALRSAM